MIAARRPWFSDAVLIAVGIGVVSLLVWTVAPSRSDWGNTRADEALYNMLVRGFRAGQLNLATPVPEALTALPDPYDPAANARFRAEQHIHDASLHRGKLYLYYGPTPALVLFWPFHAVTGRALYHKEAAVVFCAVGLAASLLLLRAVARRYFPDATMLQLGTAAAGMGFANSVPLMLRQPGICEVAIGCAYAFVMLAVLALWRSLHDPRLRWVALASLCYGLAVGARPSVLFGAVILLLPWWERRRGPASGKGASWKTFAAAVVPILAIGVALAAYNHARFGSIFEFGQRYQLAGDRQDTAEHFSARYVWFNLRVYFLEPEAWQKIFPFVRGIVPPPLPAGHAPVESGYGILVNTPFALLALAAPLAWRQRAGEERRRLRLAIAMPALWFLVSVGTMALFYGTCVRYQVEFHPPLALLAAVGLLALCRRASGLFGRWTQVAAGLLVAWSVAFTFLANVRGYGAELHLQAVIAVQEKRIDDALRGFASALRFNPDLWETHERLGALHQLERNDPRAAVRHFELALRLNPRSVEAHYGLALAHEALGESERIVPHLGAALNLQPSLEQAYLDHATAAYTAGRMPEAVARFVRLLGQRPNNAAAENGLGCALAHLGRGEEAVRHLARAVALQPDFGAAYANLGDVLMQQSRPAEAARCYERAIALRHPAPNLADALRAAQRAAGAAPGAKPY